MKKKLMAITLLAATAAFGEIWTISVPAGETKYLQTEVESLIAAKGHEFASGDIIEKEGGGRLIGTNTWKTADIGLRVKEGVYEARFLGDLFAGNFVSVSDGASLLVNNKAANGSSMCNEKRFYLNGHGHADAAVNGVTGALIFGGNQNYQVMYKCTFELQSDATIALGIKGQFGMFTYGIINQNGHKLTLLSLGHTLGDDGNAAGGLSLSAPLPLWLRLYEHSRDRRGRRRVRGAQHHVLGPSEQGTAVHGQEPRCVRPGRAVVRRLFQPRFLRAWHFRRSCQ